MAAHTMEVFIEHGYRAALDLMPSSEPQQSANEGVYVAVTPPPVPTPAPPRPVQEVPLPEVPEEPKGEPAANVVPLAARGQVSSKQLEARSSIERTRHERAMRIFEEFKLAKAAGHKDRLREDMHRAGLGSFPIVINGEARTLESYIGSD